MVNHRRHYHPQHLLQQRNDRQDRLSLLDDNLSLELSESSSSSNSNSIKSRHSLSSSCTRQQQQQQRHHHHHQVLLHHHHHHLSKTSLLLFAALLIGGLVIPVAISFSSILNDKNVTNNTSAIVLILQNSKTTTKSQSLHNSRQQQQQQQQETSLFGTHHRMVYLDPHHETTTTTAGIVNLALVEPMTTRDACPYCLVEADSHRWPFEERFYKKCKPMKEWQTKSFPTCNILHQLDMIPQLVPVVQVVPTVSVTSTTTAPNASINNATTTTTKSVLSPSLLSTSGSWRTVWTVQDTAVVEQEPTTILVAKFLKFTHRNFTHESFEKHNTDALVMEHLTSSPYILSAHAYCGQSVITEHADTEIRSFIKRADFGSRSRLKLAHDMAAALAVVHYRDDMILLAAAADSTQEQQQQQQPFRATIAHNDLNIANVVIVNNNVKLNDFNIAILLRQQQQQRRRPYARNDSSLSEENLFEACGAPVRFANDMWKSPEDVANLTYTDPAASDVYSLGNLLFHVLTRRMPWGALEPEFEKANSGNSSSNINNMTSDMVNATTMKRPPRLSKEVVRQRKLLQGPNNETLASLLASSTPHIPIRFLQSNKTSERALVLAIQACYRHDPASRPTSHELARSLIRAMVIVDKTHNRHDSLILFPDNRTTILDVIFAKDYWTRQQQKD